MQTHRCRVRRETNNERGPLDLTTTGVLVFRFRCPLSYLRRPSVAPRSWGGCVVAMVSSTGADEFVEFVKERFYATRATGGRNVDQLIFATNPSEGARCVPVTPSFPDAGTPVDLPALARFF